MKISKVESNIAKAQEKIKEYEAMLKQFLDQKSELEGVEILRLVDEVWYKRQEAIDYLKEMTAKKKKLIAKEADNQESEVRNETNTEANAEKREVISANEQK